MINLKNYKEKRRALIITKTKKITKFFKLSKIPPSTKENPDQLTPFPARKKLANNQKNKNIDKNKANNLINIYIWTVQLTPLIRKTALNSLHFKVKLIFTIRITAGIVFINNAIFNQTHKRPMKRLHSK